MRGSHRTTCCSWLAGQPPRAPLPAGWLLQDVRDSLQLLEVWRAEVAGSRLVRAGVDGSVRLKLAPYGLNRTRFRLQPAPSSLVNACLRAALLHGQYASRQGATGIFSAAIARAPVGCEYLKYR